MERRHNLHHHLLAGGRFDEAQNHFTACLHGLCVTQAGLLPGSAARACIGAGHSSGGNGPSECSDEALTSPVQHHPVTRVQRQQKKSLLSHVAWTAREQQWSDLPSNCCFTLIAHAAAGVSNGLNARLARQLHRIIPCEGEERVAGQHRPLCPRGGVCCSASFRAPGNDALLRVIAHLFARDRNSVCNPGEYQMTEQLEQSVSAQHPLVQYAQVSPCHAAQ